MTIRLAHIPSLRRSRSRFCAFVFVGLLAASPALAETLVNTTTASDQNYPAVACDSSGNFVVAWHSGGQDGNGYGVFAQRLQADGTPLGSEFQVNTYTVLDQGNAAVGRAADGRFTIAWQSLGEDAGNSWGVFARRYAADGTPEAAPFMVNPVAAGNQTGATIAMAPDGRSVIAWQGYGTGDAAGVFCRLYDASGAAQGTEILVHPGNDTVFEIGADVAMDDTGNFAVVWERLDGDGDGSGVYCRLFDSTGTPVTAEFAVNTTTAGDQSAPSVAMDSDGDFVVVWQDSGADGDLTGVFGQRYDSAGTPQGAEFAINTTTTGDQRAPGAGMDSGGNFTVTWESDGQDGDSFGVFGRMYDPAGGALTGEFQVNTTATGIQIGGNHAVEPQGGGDWLLGWYGNGVGDDIGVFYDLFALPAQADLAIGVVVDNPDRDPGDGVAFTVTVTNLGPDDATGVQILDPVPAGLTFVSASPAAGTYDEGTGVWYLGTVAASGSATLALNCTVDAGTEGSTITNTAAVQALNENDPAAANDSDSVNVNVNAASADLSVAKTVDVAAPAPADTVTYTVTVANAGASGATGVELTDSLPAGVTFVSAAPSQGSYDAGTGVWTVGDVAAAGSATLDITGTVDAGTAGQTITNTASITAADQADPNAADNTASRDIDVISADLDLEMSVVDAGPAEGGTVVYNLLLTNRGPDTAPGVALSDTLPAGVSFVSALATRGSYDEATGVWTMGDLANGESGTLTLTATVDAGTAGQTITNTARVVSFDGFDLDPVDNQDSVDILVDAADLQLENTVDVAAPNAGDAIVFTLTLSNLGHVDATGVAVADTLPAGLSFVSSAPSQGSYDAGTGIWDVGDLANAAAATLGLTCTVDAGAGGSTLTNTARVGASDVVDPVPGNDSATAAITVQSADLELTKTADVSAPLEGSTVVYTLRLRNLGPDTATGVAVADTLPAGLGFVSSTASQGSYDEASGLWNVGSVAATDTATLDVTCSVGAGTAGSTITNTARIAGADQADPVAANDADTAALTPLADTGAMTVQAVTLDPATLAPGGGSEPALEFRLTNTGDENDTVTSLTVSNATIGPGTPAQLDSDWSELSLRVRGDNRLNEPATSGPGAVISGAFTGGLLTFSGLAVEVPAGGSVNLVVLGAASLASRDGDRLAAALADANALTCDRSVDYNAVWPVVSAQPPVVDGLVAGQIALHEVDPGLFPQGSVRNLVLDVTVPANGYADDVLERLNVVNLGDAAHDTDIVGLAAWADDGDGLFDAALDLPLGDFAYTGARWELTGIDTALPAGGRRVFVTADISADAVEGRSVRMALPTLPDVGIGTADGNDGPLDRVVANPYAQGISASNRVLLSGWPIDPGPAAPGAQDLPLLQIVATNTYAETRTLTSLAVTNGSAGAASAGSAELDAGLAAVILRADGDGDGELDGMDIDPVLASGAFSGGRAVFTGIAWELPADATGHLFVTGDVSATEARDGDVLGARVESGADLTFATGTAVTASWPLDSEAAWTVDGMTAAQIDLGSLPGRTLTPSEGPVAVLDLTVPRNGYEDDTLLGLTLVNAGTAEPADVAELRLWRDGGDGLFTPGSGDDADLGALIPVAGAWSSATLSEPLGPGGARLFVGLTVAPAPTESATVQLSVPISGIAVASGNDGPVDEPATADGVALLSDAPLLAALEFTIAETTVGAPIGLRMIVRNEGDENLRGVAPTVPVALGGGSVLLDAVPSPASLDLAIGQADTFTWSGTATGAGPVTVSASARGTGEATAQERSSAGVATRELAIHDPVTALDVYSVTNMPFTLNRGQTDVVPLTLTFLLPENPLSSSAEITGLDLRIEQADGTAIIPADLLERVTVSEGALNYLQTTDLATTGDHIDLVFPAPILIEPGEPVSVAIRLDISAVTGVTDFRLTIDDASWFGVRDAISGAPVTAVLQEGSFPIESVAGTIVFEATGLEISADGLVDGTVGAGQANVPLLGIELFNPGLSTLGSTVLLDALEFTLEGADGILIEDPATRLGGIRLVASGQTAAVIEAADAGSGVLRLQPETALTVPVNSTVSVEIRGDLAASCPPGEFRARLADPSTLTARDANSGETVTISYSAGASTGPLLDVERQADRVLAACEPLLPSTLVIGARSATALTLDLRHPGDADYARVLVDSLRLSCRDDDRELVPPSALIDKIELRAGETVLGVLYDPAGGGELTLPVTGLALEPGQTAQLTLLVDFEPDAPPTNLEFVLDGDGFFARDANLGSSVALEPEAGEELPLTSGLTRLQAAPEELVVGFEDRMPAVLAADGTEICVAGLSLANPAGAETAAILLASLTLRAADGDRSEVVAGTWIAEALLVLDGEPWGSVELAETDTLAVVTPDGSAELSPGQTLDLDVRVRMRPGCPAGSLRIGLDAGDVAVTTAGGATASVRIETENGTDFPFWTAVGNLGPATLADSYSNFPNPFAAGREQTRFVFQLASDATVTLRLMTAHWRPVATILDREPRAAGLHQDDAWDGRNGNGVTVQNGVYVAELVVEYANGTRERHLRKVAVVR